MRNHILILLLFVLSKAQSQDTVRSEYFIGINGYYIEMTSEAKSVVKRKPQGPEGNTALLDFHDTTILNKYGFLSPGIPTRLYKLKSENYAPIEQTSADSMQEFYTQNETVLRNFLVGSKPSKIVKTYEWRMNRQRFRVQYEYIRASVEYIIVKQTELTYLTERGLQNRACKIIKIVSLTLPANSDKSYWEIQ